MKYFLLPMFFLISLLPSHGQKVKYGVLAGVNFSHLPTDDAELANSIAYALNEYGGFTGFNLGYKQRTGLATGVFVDIPVSRSLSVIPTLLYMQKGVKFTGSGVYGGYSVDANIVMQLDYIDLNIFTKFNITKTEVRPFIECGPGLGILINSRMKTTISAAGDSDSESVRLEDYTKNDLNLGFGAGIDFYDALILDFRYYLGINKVNRDSSGDAPDLRNRVLSLTLMANF